jgi:nucleotide-binding universal stress UspA family protein
MAEPALHNSGPRKLLLATDLSARGDRALERAVAIAQVHDAHLTILHVVEQLDEPTSILGAHAAPSWRRGPDAALLTRRRIRQTLRADLGDTVEKATILIEEGNPAEVIERVAESALPDLIVAGIARESPFSSRPVALGKTIERLLRQLPAPILIVRNRPRDAYQQIVVATDFSAPSGHAVQLALRFFPAQTLRLLHAFEAPYARAVVDQESYIEDYRQKMAEEMNSFLESVFLPSDDRRRLLPLIEPGPPQQIVREYVQLHDADLVVLGTRGRGAVLEAFIGSTAKSILSTLPCDALVVRGPRS